MQKRGLGDQVLIYILAVVVLGGIALFGWKMVSNSASTFCETELVDFQLLLGEGSKGLRQGEVVQKNVNIPCGAERVYLFDAGNKPSPDLFEDPMLKDAVASNAAKNVYVVKDGRAFDSFESSHLEIPYPYFTCMMPSSGKIEFVLRGLGRGVGVEPSCERKNCVVVPMDIPSEHPLSGKFSIEREYRQCEGNLNMDIRITPIVRGSQFTYRETIPSCADAPIEQYGGIEEFESLDIGERALVYDGSLGIVEPVTLSYEVLIPLSDSCIEEIKGELS